MDISYQERLTRAEELLRRNEPALAQQVLEDMILGTPVEEQDEKLLPRALFDLGNAALLNGDDLTALQMYDRSIRAGNEEYGVFLNMARVLEEMEEYTLEQYILENTANMGFEGPGGRLVQQTLHRFFLRREMYLRARRVAERYIDDHPEEYFGYHLHVLEDQARGKYDEAAQRLDELEERFGQEPAWLLDRLDLLAGQKQFDELLQLTDQDQRYRQIIPELALQRRLQACLELRRADGLRRTAKELFEGWGDEKGSFAQMMVAVGDDDFHTAAVAAAYILQSQKDQPGLVYYTTMYLDPIILWRLCDGAPDEEQQAVMERAARVALDWFRERGMYDERMAEPLEKIGIRL